MPQRKVLTIKDVSQIILKKGLISENQYGEILVKGDAQSARLQSYQQAGYSRRFHKAPELVSPAEVISSFNLLIPGSSRVLTEDAITEVIASAIDMEYLKLDPLKLNLEIVTGMTNLRQVAVRKMLEGLTTYEEVIAVTG